MRRRAFWAAAFLAGGYVACGSSEGGEELNGLGGSASGKAGSSAGTSAGTSSGGTSGAAGESGQAGGGGDGGSAADGGSTGSGGSATGGGSGGGTGAKDSGFPDVVFNYDAPTTDTGGEACAAATAKAEPVELDMYIILDKSGSMHDPMTGCSACGGFLICNPCGDCNVGDSVGSKWCRSVNALYGFFSASSSIGMGVALQYFSGSSCGALTTPAVPLQILPAHLAQLQSSLNSTSPSGGTPTGAAAAGIVGFTSASQQPGRKMIGIIVTDGDPTDCGDPSAVGSTLTNHFNSTGIATFIVGMEGATFGALETMASGAGAQPHTNYCGGGISPCHFYNVGNGDPQAFIDALTAIQQSSVGCVFNMPTADGGIVDPGKIDVEYVPGGTGAPQKISKVNDAGSCTGAGGWYYDNNSTPTTISLCPTTCGAIQTDNAAQVNVLLGCLGS